MAPLRILLVDNRDSYTHNLAHLLAAANGAPPTVVPADAHPSLAALRAARGAFDAHVVSPGPGSPHEPADLPRLASEALADTATPALGVCLGHQALCAAAGGRVGRAPAGPVHGRVRRVHVVQHGDADDGDGPGPGPGPGHAAFASLFQGLAPGFDAVRYHSLAADPASLAASGVVPTAWCYDDPGDGAAPVPVLMAVQHAAHPWAGVQFHPESVLTPAGRRIADNFVRAAAAWRDARGYPRAAPPASISSAPRPPLLPAAAKSARGGGAALRVRRRRLADVRADSARAFGVLFGEREQAFWLDSSSSATSASLSRCSSGEMPVGRDVAVDASTNSGAGGGGDGASGEAAAMHGRFSLMGDLRGPRSELVTYDVSARTVTVRSGGVGEEEEKEKKVGEAGSRNSSVLELPGRTVFDYLEEQLAARRVALDAASSEEDEPELPLEMNGGYVGFCGYEAKADVDGMDVNTHKSALPDAWFAFADRVVFFDHSDQSVYLIAVVAAGCEREDAAARAWFRRTEDALLALSDGVSHLSPATAAAAAAALKSGRHLSNRDRAEPGRSQDAAGGRVLEFALERDRAAYEEDVRRCLEYIADGESYEICLTNRLRAVLPDDVDVLAVYQTLRLVNPAPYAAFIRLARDTAVCCSSPERFLRASADGLVESKPIKGTRPRGSSVREDDALARDLRTCEKDRSENLMIVDLVRNDLARTCTPGSVTVPVLMQVETYASVHQLVSSICGVRRPGVSTVECIRKAYPMGSMTGAPKVRTVSLIDALERSPRGVYSGTIGYLSLCGAADMNVVIRSAVLSGRQAEIGVGGAVVAMSLPSEEFAEILVKGRPLMQALALVSTGTNSFDVKNSSRTVSTRRPSSPAVD